MSEQERIVSEANAKAGVQLLNLQGLEAACLNKQELISRLLEIFQEQVPGWIAEIKASVDAADPQRIRQICHTIKGATAAIHANECVKAAEALGILGREGIMEGTEEAKDRFVSVIEQTKDLVASMQAT